MSFSELSERTLNNKAFINGRAFPGENGWQENCKERTKGTLWWTTLHNAQEVFEGGGEIGASTVRQDVLSI